MDNKIVIILVIVGFVVISIFLIYNSIVSTRNKVKRSKSVIDIYLKKRFDLIPNLVETVKGYAKHESSLLDSVISKKNSYLNSNDKSFKDAEDVNNDFNKLIALAEGYPDLKASEQFLNLQKELSKIESEISAARRIYNVDVEVYNTKISTVPTNILAKILGYKEVEYFEIDDSQRKNVKINLGKDDE